MGLCTCHRNSYSALQFSLLIFCCLSQFTVAIDTIRVNQPLTDPQTLVSNGKKFKLGFFSPVNSTYHYVGVMFNVPVMTVIWVANRENPISDSNGTMEISGDGNLVVLDGRKAIVWSSNLSTPIINSTAVLLDTGNLVLQDNSINKSRVIWESFRHASDSFVENLELFTGLKEKNFLTSWRRLSDPSPGNFTFSIEARRIPELFLRKNGIPCWRSGPWNGQIFTGLPSMVQSFYQHSLNVTNPSPGTVSLSFKLFDPSRYFVLNSSGVLQGRVWSDEKGDWVMGWSSIDNQCDTYGVCGSFGSCNNKDKSICRCFPGFKPKIKDEWNNANWGSGCLRKNQIRCGMNNSVGIEDEFLKMSGVRLPDYSVWFPIFEEDCKVQCLNNCSCVAYAFTVGIGCMHWAGELIDVQKFPRGIADLYIRVAYSELSKKKDRTKIIVTTVVIGLAIIFLCAYFLRKLLLKYRARRKRQNVMIWYRTVDTDTEKTMIKYDVNGVTLEEFPLYKFKMLYNATDKFDIRNKLGHGGFGPLYKGKLQNGQEIAVKRLARSSNQGLEEFMNEVGVISKLQHRNLVKLLGCCVDTEEKMLVYEYMPNGSLDAYLIDSHTQEFLDWQTRVRIIEGICRGLLYLHRDSRLRIIHRDLKASNILLNEELTPKISDFGMARIFGGKEDQANTSRVVGTFGYMAPEYVLHGIFSEKSDIYSFGVLLLEILSGRRNSTFYHEEEQLFLVAYVWKLWNEEKIANLMEPEMNDPEIEIDMLRYINVGLLCVQDISSDRPSISTVLSMLNCEITELPRPKQPAFVGVRKKSVEEECSDQKNSSKCSVDDETLTIVQCR